MSYNTSDFGADYKVRFIDVIKSELDSTNILDQQFWSGLTTTIDMTQTTEQVKLFGAIPLPELFLDEVTFTSGYNYSQSFTLKMWQRGIKMDYSFIRDQRFNEADRLVRGLTTEFARFKDRLLTFYIEAGDGTAPTQTFGLGTPTTTTWDGVNFFSASHSYGAVSTNQSNLRSTGSVLNIDNLEAAIQDMTNLQNDQNYKWGIMPTHIMVPTALTYTARKILESQDSRKTFDSDSTAASVYYGTKNVVAGELQLIVNPYLTDDDDWYLFSLNNETKPFVYLRRNSEGAGEQTFMAGDNPTDWFPFVKDQIHYGIKGEWNFGYLWWPYAQKNEV